MKRGDDGRTGVTLVGMFSLLVGTIIGAGWIAATSAWVAEAGPIGAIIAFGLGAALMALIGLCFAELVAMMPDSGGIVGYTYGAFGSAAAYIVGALLVLSYVATIGFFVTTLPYVVQMALPGICAGSQQIFGFEIDRGALVLGGLGTVLVFLANWHGTRLTVGLQNGLVIAKFMLVVVLCGVALAVGRVAPDASLMAGAAGQATLSGVTAVAITTPFWFSGFEVLPQAMGERAAGVRLARIGRLVILAIIASFLFYAAIILAYASLAERIGGSVNGPSVYQVVHEATGSGALAGVVILLALVGILSSWNSTTFTTARILDTLSRAHLAPAGFSRARSADGAPVANGVPVVSLLLPSCCGYLLGLAGRGLSIALITAASVMLVIVFLFACGAVIRLRRIAPDLPRPYRVPGRMVAPWVAVVASVLLLVLAMRDLLLFPAAERLAPWTALGVGGAAIALCWIVGGRRRRAIDERDRGAILATSSL